MDVLPCWRGLDGLPLMVHSVSSFDSLELSIPLRTSPTHTTPTIFLWNKVPWPF